jgi:aldose 1-epimerase
LAGSEFDFSTGRPLGSMRLDTGFCDLVREPDDSVRVELDHPDGERGLTLWADSGFSYLMVYTGDNAKDAARRRTSIAIEPMTCPPDALRSGTSVIDLPAGSEWRGSWGISPRF